MIGLTAGVLPDEREAALEAGMDGFIAKPFETEDLVALLLRVSGRQDQARETGTTA